MGRRPFTPEDGTCTDCGTRLEPDTDGAGSAVDGCPKCGKLHWPRGAAQVPSPTAPAVLRNVDDETPARPARRASKRKVKKPKAKRAKAPRRPRKVRVRPCEVEGCPGILDEDDNCACCERRQAFREEHGQYTCAVCHGDFRADEPSKLCAACEPLTALVD